jgi:hypothetical protein
MMGYYSKDRAGLLFDRVYEYSDQKIRGSSVRCVKD